MIKPIHRMYEKISDDIVYLSSNVVFRFNVNLGAKDMNEKRRSYHMEYKYNSSKYIDQKQLITIRRQVKGYYTLENLKSTDSNLKEYIMIRAQDMLHIRDKFKEIRTWIHDGTTYRFKGKDIIVDSSVRVDIQYLAQDKYISFIPCVVEYGSTKNIGVRIFLSSNTNYCDISIDKFMELAYYVEMADIYLATQNMLNYVQRPAFGENLIEFNSYNDIKEEGEYQEDNPKTKGRKENIKRQKSFFDKIDNL